MNLGDKYLHVVCHINGIKLVCEESITEVHALLLTTGIDGDNARINNHHHTNHEIMLLRGKATLDHRKKIKVLEGQSISRSQKKAFVILEAKDKTLKDSLFKIILFVIHVFAHLLIRITRMRNKSK